MGHLKTLSLKVLVIGLPVYLILTLLGRVDWVAAAVITLILAAAAYFLGDAVILPAAGNLTATIADGALTFVLLLASRYAGVNVDTRTIVYGVIAVMLLEGAIYHPYLKRLVSADSMGPNIGKMD